MTGEGIVAEAVIGGGGVERSAAGQAGRELDGDVRVPIERVAVGVGLGVVVAGAVFLVLALIGLVGKAVAACYHPGMAGGSLPCKCYRHQGDAAWGV